MNSRSRPLIILIIGGLFLFLDRFLKWQALGEWSAPRLCGRFFGWEPSLNHGVAFSIPLPNWLIIALTAPIIGLAGFLLYNNIAGRGRCDTRRINYLPLSLIFLGALSNLCDRLIYQGTIDYFLLLTAVINLADVMIVAGFGLYLYQISKIKYQK